MENEGSVLTKKKPVRAYNFDSIPRAIRNNAKRRMQNAELRTDGAGSADVKFKTADGKVYCDGQVFEGKDALRAAWEHVGIVMFLRKCGRA